MNLMFWSQLSYCATHILKPRGIKPGPTRTSIKGNLTVRGNQIGQIYLTRDVKQKLTFYDCILDEVQIFYAAFVLDRVVSLGANLHAIVRSLVLQFEGE